jgi:ComF family protein
LKVSPSLKEILRDFISLLYPRYCFACENALVHGEDGVCTHCISEMPRTDYHINRSNAFFFKLQGRVKVNHVMAFFKFVKQSRVQNLIHSLKYRNHPEIGIVLGRVYGHELANVGLDSSFDIILSVPLHESRKAARGYNQSYEFAKGLSEVLEIPAQDDLIKRIHKTKTQTSKTRLKRWKNVDEVFQVPSPEKIANKRILLVDDVITTGATIEACANALEKCNPQSISIACIAAAQQ